MNVYFIVTNGCKPRMLKIGKARDAEARLVDLQCACPYELELRGVLKCSSERHAFAAEKNLHSAFRRFHHRGEWFFYPLEVKYAVDSILQDGRVGNVGDFQRHIFVARSNRLRDDVAAPESCKDSIDYNTVLDQEFAAIVG